VLEGGRGGGGGAYAVRVCQAETRGGVLFC
jgi:hypothetical protein